MSIKRRFVKDFAWLLTDLRLDYRYLMSGRALSYVV